MLNLEFSEILVELGTAESESESSVYLSFILLLSQSVSRSWIIVIMLYVM
jgi:hypothetical protein